MIQWYIPSKVYLEGTAMRCPQIELGTTKILQIAQWWATLGGCVEERGSNISTAKQMRKHPGFRPVQTRPFSQVRCSLWPDLHGSRCPDSMIPCLDSVSQLSWQWTQPAGHFSCITCMFVKLFTAASSPCVARLSWKTSGSNCILLVPICLPFLHVEPKRPLLQSCHCQMSCSFRLEAQDVTRDPPKERERETIWFSVSYLTGHARRQKRHSKPTAKSVRLHWHSSHLFNTDI